MARRKAKSESGGGGGVTELNGLSGVVNLVEGAGIDLTVLGQDITIAAIGANVPSDTSLAVKVATTAVLPGTPTYNNGTSGVGATLTRSSNGTTGTIDGVTAANLMAGDYILVKNQAAQLQNGVYVITQQGTASLPYILTRVTEADTTAELDDLVVTAALGSTNKGIPFGQQTNNPTIGTSNIVFTATGIYMRQQTSGTQAINQIPVYTGTAMTQTKGTSAFKYNPTTNAFTVRGVDYLFPSSQGAASTTLTNDGLGNLSWAAGGSPITIGTSGNTLYSSGLVGTGQGDTTIGYNIILGGYAGYGATNAYASNFSGFFAGYGATNAYASNFLGYYAGQNATNAANSNFFGASAGRDATNAFNSNFLGQGSGNSAENAAYSVFSGDYAGSNAFNANNSIFLGNNAGINDNVNNSGELIYSSLTGAFQIGDTVFSTLGGIGYVVADNGTNTLKLVNTNNLFAPSDTITGGFSGASATIDSFTPSGTSILIGDNTSTGGFSNSIAIGAGATNTAANEMQIGSSTSAIHTVVINGTGGIQVPVGTTGERVAVQGTIRYNTTTSKFEGYDGSTWVDFH